MKPRPPVMPSLNSPTTPIDRCAPASPASAPANTVEASRIVKRIEADRADGRLGGAGGAQPQARARTMQERKR